MQSTRRQQEPTAPNAARLICCGGRAAAAAAAVGYTTTTSFFFCHVSDTRSNTSKFADSVASREIHSRVRGGIEGKR